MKRVLEELVNAALIATGILSAGMGLKGFLLSSNFIDGGVTGVCMLLAKTTPESIVRALDGQAFVVFHPLTGAEGGVVKQRSH